MQTTNKQLGGVSLGYRLSRFVMVYREYTEDWRFRDRAPLSTQAYPGRSHLSQQKKHKKTTTGNSTHTRVSFGGGGEVLGFPLIPKTSYSPPPLPKTPAFLPLPFLHNPNKTESGCVDFPFRTDYKYPQNASESISELLFLSKF